jgi:alpha-2-macroglobulin
MAPPSRHYHTALFDPLPAGFEALNPELAIAGHIPQDPKDQMKKWLWAWQWFEHQNMSDERVEDFTSLLWEGVYNYSYVARATTPGAFVVPPSKAEEMYHPKTFGPKPSGQNLRAKTFGPKPSGQNPRARGD